MATTDLESHPPPLSHSYAPLPDSDKDTSADTASPALPRSRSLVVSLALSFVFLFALAGLISRLPYPNPNPNPGTVVPDRGGVEESESSESSGPVEHEFLWGSRMPTWQRTGYHFHPEKNWMNDPSGPLFYKGWYHLFYQYNPDSACWGNISWGHSVSHDLVNWQDLPLAMVRDQWYDIEGAMTGSATFLPDGRLVMLYTGRSKTLLQMQCLAEPADLSDPFLINWVKSEANPVLLPPPGIGDQDFRDPTSAWVHPIDKTWHFLIGSKHDKDHTGIAMVYRTTDFLSFELLPDLFHSLEKVGMWECLDFYPVSTTDTEALDISVPPGENIKHILKESSDDDRHDWYTIGTYDPVSNTYTPDDPELDLGIGLRYDWGKFYASKTFLDVGKKRRVVWGYARETDSEKDDIAKGWASVMNLPRTIHLDVKTGSNLITWPVEEVNTLRTVSKDFSGITVDPGSTFKLNISNATQLDIEAEFEVNTESLEAAVDADVGYNCSTGSGAANRGRLGPFGLLVLANEEFSEQTATYFYIARGKDGVLKTFFCQDESRSSLANDIVKRMIGYTVPVLAGETLSVRILVDHSIVESFAQGGRASATSRVYPTKAIYSDAGVFLFNNATGASVTAKRLKVWVMSNNRNTRYPLQ